MIPEKPRFKPLDAVWLALFAAFGLYIWHRVHYGLQYQGDWSEIPRFLFRRDPDTGGLVPNHLIQGLAATIRLSVWSVLLGSVIGIVMGLLRAGKNLFFRLTAGAYVELIRNLPPLVLIFVFYFFVVDQFLPLLGAEAFIRDLSPGARAVFETLFAQERLFVQFISGVAAIGFLEGAYITEIIRAGIQSVEKGQREAGRALGLSRLDRMRFIILPQAVRRVLPPLANEFINAVKYSAIASVVSIQELTFMGRQVVETTRLIFETWITVSVMYLSLTLSLSLLVGRLEKKLGRID
ncbi:Amino acid ABC transporter permease [Candidatus Desulfarcum epimagneticum]|uniref:Amino acid ABC transporter permease n=1 Tax=uncultured Desulfobacteraceae bacterium TaxID=218296 RepID=A0A484HF16_9BACT|nr:Amino acid ABC transporter permease [uncultured Desulfobacteraceae bacterium]